MAKKKRMTIWDMPVPGPCPKCGGIQVRTYSGDMLSLYRDARLFRYRCYTCEPEKAADSNAPLMPHS